MSDTAVTSSVPPAETTAAAAKKQREPIDVRDFAKRARCKGLPPPKNLTMERIRCFSPEIDAILKHWTGGIFGNVIWCQVPKPKRPDDEDGGDAPCSSSPSFFSPDHYVDVICSSLVEAFLPAWIPPDILEDLTSRCKTMLPVSQDFMLVLYEDVPIPVANMVSAAVEEAFYNRTVVVVPSSPPPSAGGGSAAAAATASAESDGAVRSPLCELNLNAGLSLIAMNWNTIDAQRAAGKLATPFPIFTVAKSNNNNNRSDGTIRRQQQQLLPSLNVDTDISATAPLRPAQQLQEKIKAINVTTPFVVTKQAGVHVFITLVGLGAAWWDVVMRLIARTSIYAAAQSLPPGAPPAFYSGAGANVTIKLANECSTLFPPPQSGRVVVPVSAAATAAAADYVPANTFYVRGDICSILRNITLDVECVELPPVATEAVQYSLVRVRNPAHIPRLLAAGQFCFTHELWRSQLPGFSPRSFCGVVPRGLSCRFYAEPLVRSRVPNNNNNSLLQKLIIAVDSLATRMKDDCFSLEVLTETNEIELTSYIACPLSDEDLKTTPNKKSTHNSSVAAAAADHPHNLLSGPIISQALGGTLATRNEGAGKESMLADDQRYSLSRVHSGGEPRSVLAQRAIFDAATLKFRRFCFPPERKKIVIDEELETGFVRMLEEQDQQHQQQQQQQHHQGHRRNLEVATRLKLLHVIYEVNRGLGYGSTNDHILFPSSPSSTIAAASSVPPSSSSCSGPPQLVVLSTFMRESYGRDRANCCYRASLGSGNGWSDWTRHAHKLPKFCFSAGIRAAILQTWGFDFEIGAAASASFSSSAMPSSSYPSSPSSPGVATRCGNQENNKNSRLQPLISLLRTHREIRGGYEATAEPLWAEFAAALSAKESAGDNTGAVGKGENAHDVGDGESEREVSGCIIDDDDGDDHDREQQPQQREGPSRRGVGSSAAIFNQVSLSLLAASLPQMRTLDPKIDDLIVAATGIAPLPTALTSTSTSAAPASSSARQAPTASDCDFQFRFVSKKTSELRFLIGGGGTGGGGTNNNNCDFDSHVRARRARRSFIGPFDVTDDSDFTSLLDGTKPLRDGMHTLAQYLALRPPCSDSDRERAIVRSRIQSLTGKLSDLQERSNRDSMTSSLMFLLDRAVPVPLKRMLLPGVVCAARTLPQFGKVCCVWVPRLKTFVAANVLLSRSGVNILNKNISSNRNNDDGSGGSGGGSNSTSNKAVKQQKEEVAHECASSAASTAVIANGEGTIAGPLPPSSAPSYAAALASASPSASSATSVQTSEHQQSGEFNQLPPLSFVQLLLQAEDDGGAAGSLGGTSTDSVTQSFPPLDFSAQYPHRVLRPGVPDDNAAAHAAAASWRLSPIRGKRGEVWYVQQPQLAATGGRPSLLSFHLCVDARACWHRVFPILLGSPPVAGRGSDVASMKTI